MKTSEGVLKVAVATKRECEGPGPFRRFNRPAGFHDTSPSFGKWWHVNGSCFAVGNEFAKLDDVLPDWCLFPPPLSMTKWKMPLGENCDLRRSLTGGDGSMLSDSIPHPKMFPLCCPLA